MMKTLNSLKIFFIVFAFCSFSAFAKTADELFAQAEKIIDKEEATWDTNAKRLTTIAPSGHIQFLYP